MANAYQSDLEEGAAAFYGVRPRWEHLWLKAKARGVDWFYLDNSFFDCTREQQFRVSKNCLQQVVKNGSSEKLKKLGITIKPWRETGEHIVICPQSSEYMKTVACWHGDWLSWVAEQLRIYSERPFRIRKKGEHRPLSEDLKDAWVLITHSSAAAIEALIAGIPVIVTGESAAYPLATLSLSAVERPNMPDGREAWAKGIANSQWTLEEIAEGKAWEATNA